MKKIFLFSFILIGINQFIFAQNYNERNDQDTIVVKTLSPILGEQKIFEKKGVNNTYVCTLYSSGRIMIRNKQTKFFECEPNYNPEVPFKELPRFTVAGLDSLLKMVIQKVGPYLKEKDLKFGNNLEFAFLFDLNGKIEDVYFTYPNEVSIPLVVLETLETYALKYCSVQFKMNTRLKGALYSGTYRPFPLKKIYESYKSGDILSISISYQEWYRN